MDTAPSSSSMAGSSMVAQLLAFSQNTSKSSNYVNAGQGMGQNAIDSAISNGINTATVSAGAVGGLGGGMVSKLSVKNSYCTLWRGLFASTSITVLLRAISEKALISDWYFYTLVHVFQLLKTNSCTGLRWYSQYHIRMALNETTIFCRTVGSLINYAPHFL